MARKEDEVQAEEAQKLEDSDLPIVEVVKWKDRVPVVLNDDEDLTEQVQRFVSVHGADNVFVDGESVKDMTDEKGEFKVEKRQRQDDKQERSRRAKAKEDEEDELAKRARKRRNFTQEEFDALSRPERNAVMKEEREIMEQENKEKK
jgi:hypothetical protein